MTVGLVNDSAAASNVLHGFVEKHQVHHGDIFIVLFELSMKNLTELINISN